MLTEELLDFGLVEPVTTPSPEKEDYGLGITEHSSPPAHSHSLITPVEELLDFGLGNPVAPSTSEEEGVDLSKNTGSKSFYLAYFRPLILHTGWVFGESPPNTDVEDNEVQAML